MDLDRFIVTTCCPIDDALREQPLGRPIRSRGPAPILTDSEVLTPEVVGESLGLDRDVAIDRYFRRPCAAFSPALRRVRHEPGFALVDSFPIPACQFARAYRRRRCRAEAAFGKDTLVRQTFYGFRLHARLCWPGVISRVVVAPANVHELAAVPALAGRTSGLLPGDRNYRAPALARDLARAGVGLVAPFRRARRDPAPRRAAVISRSRYRIDTLFGQPVERYHAKQVRARDAWHLWSRLLRKVLSHTLAVLLATETGLPPLHLAHLVTE